MSSLHEVMQQITKCRKAGEVSYSNFYPGESMDTEYQMTAGEKTVVFWRKKEGVFRVYFHTADLEELKVLLIICAGKGLHLLGQLRKEAITTMQHI